MDKINNVQEYISIVEQYKGKCYFRGQANAKWNVEPNIFRNDTKLNNECNVINMRTSDSSTDILKRILKVQHYDINNGTRLCDLTVNPMVALYFSIEDDNFDNDDAAIYIFDKSEEVTIDSIEMKILLILTANEIATLRELQKEIFDKLGLTISEEDVKRIIVKNYIINYDMELAFSNKRAQLQGGTGIYYGFAISNNNIIRKGNINISNLCNKIIIPKSIKKSVRNYLYNYGIRKTILYDTRTNTPNKLTYSVVEKKIMPRASFSKVILNITVSDVVYTEEEIYNITKEVVREYKCIYGSTARVYIYIYYDEEDLRCSNWIARPTPSNENVEFDLNFNNNYHCQRMMHLNEEISFDTIYSVTEPIVKKCIDGLNEINILFKSYCASEITRQDYRDALKELVNKMNKTVYFDLQDISHGRIIYDDYYKSSNDFGVDLMRLAEEQIIYIDRNENDYTLEFNYKMNIETCSKSRNRLDEAYRKLNVSCKKK